MRRPDPFYTIWPLDVFGHIGRRDDDRKAAAVSAPDRYTKPLIEKNLLGCSGLVHALGGQI